MPSVWRVRMESASKDVAVARQFAIQNGIVGAGWGLNNPPNPGPLPDGCDDVMLYKQQAKLIYPNDKSVEGAADNFAKMGKGDICWMYVTHSGEYWCCRIQDDKFRYREAGDFDEHDLHIIRRCTWARAGAADAVPGVIRRAFAGQFGTISKIVNGASSAIEAAEVILDQKTLTLDGDLFALASPEDFEDIVALYLQDKGWRILPSTAKASMASYEFVLVHQQTGKRAGVQVKSGDVSCLVQKVASDFDVFFVFLANPKAVVSGDANRITRLSREEIASYAKDNWNLLPRRLKLRWPISQDVGAEVPKVD